MKQVLKTMIRLAVLAVICIPVLCGCSSEEEKQSRETVSAFLTAYQEQDPACGEYLVGNEEGEAVSFEGFQSVLASPLSFEIDSVDSEEDGYTVNVVITNVDFGAALESMEADSFEPSSSDELLQELENRLCAEDAATRKFEVPVPVTQDQKIEMTSHLSNALLGGYTEYISNLTMEVLQDEESN